MPETITDFTLYAALLDSMPDVVVFADTEHIIRYLNAAAIRQYRAGVKLLGKSVFACHAPASREKIREVFSRLQAGAEEEMIAESDQRRVFMRAVRDAQGTVIGYYERYENAWK